MATLIAGIAGAASSGGLMTALKIGGTLLSFAGQMQAASAAEKAAEFEAAQLEQQGQTERAAAQRKAIEERKKKDFAISRARASGAAGGGGLDYNVIGDLEEEGEYRALSEMWLGDERAKGRQMEAEATRYSAQQRAAGIRRGAGSSLLEGFASTFKGKYA